MSNLLQKASIITTPTAYDTGKILSVKPVQYYGPELVTNGDFSNGQISWTTAGSDATHIATFNGDTLRYQSDTTSPQLIVAQAGVLEVGKIYKITIDVKTLTSGSLKSDGLGGLNMTPSVGVNTFYATATGTTFNITRATTNVDITIDNVSVKEALNADFDFTRNSSATRVGSNGLIQDVASNIPRIDYTGGVGSWKFEPQRTNILLYSEDFSQWTNSNSSDLSNQIISPNGTLNADKLITNNGSINGQITKTLTKSASAITYNYSVFAKKGEWNRCNLYVSDAGSFANRVQFFVDLETGDVIQATTAGAFSSASGSSENYGNGWYRFSVTFTTSTETAITARIYSISSLYTIGDGTSGIYIWGAQLEVGNYATSYIPTSGQSGGVTRLADVANNAGSSDLINSSEGVLMAETKGENDGTFNYISLNDGNTTNYCGILYTDNDNEITYRYYVGGSGVQIIISGIDVTNFNKIAVKWKVNDFAIWINGYELGTSSSGSVNPSGTFDQLAFARGGSNNTPFYGNTKSVAVFKEALTDLELECLVSWMSFSDLGINFGYTVE